MIKTWKSPDGTSFSVCPTYTCGRPTITPTGTKPRCCARCLHHSDTDWAQREEDERQRLVARSRCETSCLINSIEVNLTPWSNRERPATGKEFLEEVARSGLTAESCDRMGESAEPATDWQRDAERLRAELMDTNARVKQAECTRDEALADRDFFDRERQDLVDQIEGSTGLLVRCEALTAEAVRLREERDARGPSTEMSTRAEDEAITLRSALGDANEAAAQRSRAADGWAERARNAEARVDQLQAAYTETKHIIIKEGGVTDGLGTYPSMARRWKWGKNESSENLGSYYRDLWREEQARTAGAKADEARVEQLADLVRRAEPFVSVYRAVPDEEEWRRWLAWADNEEVRRADAAKWAKDARALLADTPTPEPEEGE